MLGSVTGMLLPPKCTTLISHLSPGLKVTPPTGAISHNNPQNPSHVPNRLTSSWYWMNYSTNIFLLPLAPKKHLRVHTALQTIATDTRNLRTCSLLQMSSDAFLLELRHKHTSTHLQWCVFCLKLFLHLPGENETELTLSCSHPPPSTVMPQ